MAFTYLPLPGILFSKPLAWSISNSEELGSVTSPPATANSCCFIASSECLWPLLEGSSHSCVASKRPQAPEDRLQPTPRYPAQCRDLQDAK